jgi:hypothetical protein
MGKVSQFDLKSFFTGTLSMHLTTYDIYLYMKAFDKDNDAYIR